MRHHDLFEDAEKDLTTVRYAQRAVGKIWRYLTSKTETTPLRDAGFMHVQTKNDDLWMFPVTDAGLPHQNVMFAVGWRKSFSTEKEQLTRAYVATGRDGTHPTINLIVLLDHDPADDTDVAWKLDWSTLVHEFVHVLDYRRGYTRHKERARQRQRAGRTTGYNDTPDEYFNSPIEFNAYYQQGAAEILNKLTIGVFKMRKTPTYESDYRTAVLADFSSFQREFLPQFNRDWLRHLNAQSKRRFVKRLYQLFVFAQEHWPNMAAIKDMEEDNARIAAEFAKRDQQAA